MVNCTDNNNNIEILVRRHILNVYAVGDNCVTVLSKSCMIHLITSEFENNTSFHYLKINSHWNFHWIMDIHKLTTKVC